MMAFERIKDRYRLLTGTKHPWAPLVDSIRLSRRSYVVQAKSGIRMQLWGGNAEWYTFLETLVREDYLRVVPPLQVGDKVLDIGANLGGFTLAAARRVGAEGHVFAFEPDPEVCDRLKDNVKINGFKNITVYNAAVASERGQGILLQHSNANALSSLYGVVDQRVQSDRKQISVDMLGINDVMALVRGPVRLIKVDCEGAEYSIFRAFNPKHLSNVQMIAMELHSVPGERKESLVESLRSSGFKITMGHTCTAIRQESM